MNTTSNPSRSFQITVQDRLIHRLLTEGKSIVKGILEGIGRHGVSDSKLITTKPDGGHPIHQEALPEKPVFLHSYRNAGDAQWSVP